jgi:hypothetical protein
VVESFEELFMERYDAILTPPALGTAPKGLSSTGDPVFCSLWTLLGMDSAPAPEWWLDTLLRHDLRVLYADPEPYLFQREGARPIADYYDAYGRGDVAAAAAIGLIAMPGPIVAMLYERGEFTAEATVLTAQALAAFAAGLPAYVLIKVFSPAFFAREDMKTPMWFSIVAVAVNIVASLALFPIYGSRLGYTEAEAALLLTAVGLGNVVLQIPLGLLSDRMRDRRHLLAACAAIGLVGMLALPLIAESWYASAALLFVWGGVVAGLYTVGLAHLGSRLSGRDLASANAAFVLCYGVGMLVGPQMLGLGMDIFDTHGFAYVLAVFFVGYIGLAMTRLARGSRS